MFSYSDDDNDKEGWRLTNSALQVHTSQREKVPKIEWRSDDATKSYEYKGECKVTKASCTWEDNIK